MLKLLGALILLITGASSLPLSSIIPKNSLSHFCIVTSWEGYNATLALHAAFLGEAAPPPGVAGGPDSNGTYVIDGAPHRLAGTTKIAFLTLNNHTRMEYLAGDPAQPSWWRDVFLKKGIEVHHMGYDLPAGVAVWPVVESFVAAGLGPAVQWGRWGALNKPGSGCYVYLDSQATLGVTVEILGASSGECDGLPAQPPTAA